MIKKIKMFVMGFALINFMSVSAIEHGSMRGNGITLYPDGSTENPRTATIDFKIVTIGNNTWSWFKTNGAAITQGAAWGAQLRYWSSTNGKTENSTQQRYTSGNSTEAWVKSTAELPNPCRISFFAAIPDGNSDTEKIPYDPTVKFNKVDGDVTPPVITSAVVDDIFKTGATLNITGNDTQSDVFYYITDNNGLVDVSFRSSYTIDGLTSGTEYTLYITPIDFSGNEGTTKTVKFTPRPGIGSLRGVSVPMYPQGVTGGDTSSPAHGSVLNYKVVVLEGKAWASTQTNTEVSNNPWSSQLRYWSSGNVKTENNLLDRSRNGGDYSTFGSSNAAIPNPLRISFMQELGINNFYETALANFELKKHNSTIVSDNTPPVISSWSVTETEETTATIAFAGSDDNSDLFYYIEGDNNFEDISLLNSYTFTGLEPDINYSYKVTPIDFSGNYGTPVNVTFQTGTLSQITVAVAKDIKVVFKSSPTEFEYYYEFTDPTKKFYDAFIKITPSGGTEFELKPEVSSDKSFVYGKTSDSRIANKVINLNCGYLIDNGGAPNWDAYIMDNKVVTSGNFTGKPLMHKMGVGIDPTEHETVLPELLKAELIDVTPDYIKLSLEGNDNNGTVFYEISGAERTVNAFTKNDFLLKDIKAGNVYELSIVAKDMSDNSSTDTIVVKAKTMNARSNIMHNVGMNWNSTEITNNGGELVSIIEQNDNTLTLGCTTASPIIQQTNWRGRAFYNPIVTINNTDYSLEYTDEDKNTASITFTDFIGEGSEAIEIKDGVIISLKWALGWEDNGGRAFFTGTFGYVMGDLGQVDSDGPTKPELTLTDNTVTWPAAYDKLSGVKYYEVMEVASTSKTAQADAEIIFDLGEESFSYIIKDMEKAVVVTAVDFANNKSEYAVTNGEWSSITENDRTQIVIYPNPATDYINVNGINVLKVEIYNLSGQLEMVSYAQNRINVSSLQKGMYIVKITGSNNTTTQTKLNIN